MPNLSMIADLSTFPVTRQDLFDMWVTSVLAEGIDEGDLADDVTPISLGTDFSDAPSGTDLKPGNLFWHQADNLLFCYFDEVNDTGVSLWLAVGPDRFDVPCLTKEPIPSASPVELDYDRIVGVPTEATQVPLGFNQSGIQNGVTINDPVLRVNSEGSTVTEFGGDTAASGTWIRVAIEGIVYGRQQDPSSNESTSLIDIANAPPISMDPADPTSLITANTWATPLWNVVGIGLQETTGPSGVPTEPVFTFKFQFAPRVVVPF